VVKTPLRQRILFFASALILLSLLGSTVSLYRITEVNRSLQAINRVSVPLGRLLTQLSSDSEVLRRESERRLGLEHWRDAHWKPKALPRWIEEVIQSELSRASELIDSDQPWSDEVTRAQWREWANGAKEGFGKLIQLTGDLQQMLEKHPEIMKATTAQTELATQDSTSPLARAAELHIEWARGLDEWARRIQWGAEEYERTLRQNFSRAQDRVSELRTALEFILVLLISLSLLLLWLGERALRPLAELTRLASSIARRGLRKEDKQSLPQIPLSRNDEVSALGLEFHRMATSLLERERTVEQQRDRLQEGNRKLQAMGALNENILRSIETVLIVTDLDGRITQCNPATAHWLNSSADRIIGSRISDWPKLTAFPTLMALAGATSLPSLLEPAAIDGRTWGGHLFPLRKDDGTGSAGEIIVLEDLTDERELTERLRMAENLAAVGRLSAQVAHEVRNPLHSIGLEAEMAIEEARTTANPRLKQSLQAILASVDRLSKITDNYLKLSRLSSGVKSELDLGDVLESALADYANVCQSQSVLVEWTRMPNVSFKLLGDRDLLEQAIGNLFRNSLQALEATSHPRVKFSLSGEGGRLRFSIEDNGPGVDSALSNKLFTPFVTSKATGTGLGLSFVRRVIEDHGGRIAWDAAHSPGARFVIELSQELSRERRADAENFIS